MVEPMNIGDVCLVMGTYNHPEHIGVECTIVALYPDCKSSEGNVVNCMVRISGYISNQDINGSWWMHTSHLQRKPPKDEIGSWDEIEKISGWNPTKVKGT